MSDEAKLNQLLLSGHSHNVSMSSFSHADSAIVGPSTTGQAGSSLTSISASMDFMASSWIKMSECDEFMGPKLVFISSHKYDLFLKKVEMFNSGSFL